MPDAGWYDDPLGEGELRFWDGSRWTVGVRGRTPVTVPTDRGRSILGTFGVALASLTVILVGVIVGLLIAASLGRGPRPTLGPRLEPSPTLTTGH